MKFHWLAAITMTVLLFGTSCAAEADRKPPRGTIKRQLDPATGIRWFVTLSKPSQGACYNVVAEAPTGKRTSHGGLGCNVQTAEGPLQELAGGGFPVRDAASFTFSIGKPPQGTRIVRVTLSDGKVFSDSDPKPVWFVSWTSGFEIARIEALDLYGARIALREVKQSVGPLPAPDPGIPVVEISPRHGPVGTRVTVTGKGFDELARSRVRFGETKLGLTRDLGGCRMRGAADIEVTIDEMGNLSGSFTIPEQGSCGPPSDTAPFVQGGYAVFVGCVECRVAEFRLLAD